MLKKIIKLSSQLIRLRTNSGNNVQLNKALDLITAELDNYYLERFVKNGSQSILINNKSKKIRNYKVILNGHLDIIPGKDFQYRPLEKKGRLYGVGSMDMKANVAALLFTFKNIADKVNYPLGLQIVTDEQLGGFKTTKYQIDQGVRAKFVIAGETTNFKIVNKAKGVLWLKITYKGKTAHSAYPWRGKNSILAINSFLSKLIRKYRQPSTKEWLTTINPSNIETTNKTYNKIPDDCALYLDVRYTPEDKLILKEIQEMLPHKSKIEVVVNEPPMIVEDQNPYLQKLKKSSEKITGKKVSFSAAQGSSDARHYVQIGGSAVEFGPIGQGGGTDNEWVDIKSLELYNKILEDFLLGI